MHSSKPLAFNGTPPEGALATPFLSPHHAQGGLRLAAAAKACELPNRGSVAFYPSLSGMEGPGADERLGRLIEAKSCEELRGYVLQQLHEMEQRTLPLNLAYAFCVKVHMQVEEYLKCYFCGYTPSRTGDLVVKLLLCTSYGQLQAETALFLDRALPMLAAAAATQNHLIKQVMHFINSHFSQNLSLQLLAQKFFVHPIYLSKLFKEQAGQGFVDYLTLVRFKAAQSYLESTNLKVYDISRRVGYENPKYFGKVFKRLSGATPAKYREEYRCRVGQLLCDEQPR